MILHQDDLLALNYDVRTDILNVRWPDIKDTPVADLEASFQKLLNAVNHYDVKKLLIDSSKSVVTMDDKIYKPLVFKLVFALNATRLEKMARVMSENDLRESRLKSYAAEMRYQETLRFAAREFATQPLALAWLSSK